eukprot:365731-Chlamydomonas_euryale.AAC.8
MPEDMNSLLRDRDAEAARLRAEIGRLRSALAQAERLSGGSATEVAALTQQLQEAVSLNK